MLLGKALEEGKIKSIDDKFSDYFEEFKHKEFGDQLTLRNLAQMEAGLNWDEDYKNPFLPNAKATTEKVLLMLLFQGASKKSLEKDLNTKVVLPNF
jgi:CubicO group peptidase (beta-lactamase class C family)